MGREFPDYRRWLDRDKVQKMIKEKQVKNIRAAWDTETGATVRLRPDETAIEAMQRLDGWTDGKEGSQMTKPVVGKIVFNPAPDAAPSVGLGSVNQVIGPPYGVFAPGEVVYRTDPRLAARQWAPPPPHGAPIAAMGTYGPLPTESEERKKLPIATGVIDYFPLAFAAIAELSRIGNDKHNSGMPLHWSRGKSDDHPDCLMRHFIERGKVDVNGVRHSTQVAWRALAILQLELEAAAVAAAEEQAWRLRPGPRIDNYKLDDPVADPDDPLRFTAAAMRSEWRRGDAMRARPWPDVPDEAISLPCDVEPWPEVWPEAKGGHGEGGL